MLERGDDRPLRRRRAVRLLVRSRDESGTARVLLFADRDPGLPGTEWWVTPGGGMDPGESEHQTGVRELFEETGLQVGPRQLQGPVARRLVVHGYSDQVLVQDEAFFLVETPVFDVSTDGFTPLEQVTLLSHGWFAAHELNGREVWPAQLHGVIDWAGAPEVDWGLVEESTVPVGDLERVAEASRRLVPGAQPHPQYPGL
ncbi:NUDIX hydrolase [Propionibacteriaceae bacterium G1746]|uniref:NUDIX hydrolase n=1 Tax=Aestuariimicrobium sp. G57 TaxID=3418485 RepID=UPI003C18574F